MIKNSLVGVLMLAFMVNIAQALTFNQIKQSSNGQVLGASTPAFVQGCSSAAYGTTIRSCTLTAATAGDIVAFAVYWESTTNTLTSVTVCGTAATLVDNPTTGTSAHGRMAQGYAVIGSSGNCTVTSTVSAASAVHEITAQEISGVDTTAPLENNLHSIRYVVVNPAAANGIASSALTTTVSGDYIFGTAEDDGGNASTLTAGTQSLTYTVPANVTATNSGNGISSEYAIQPAAGSVTADFTPSVVSGFYAGIMAFQPANGTTSTTPPVISNIASSGITSSAATITWTTDVSSDSQVDYGTTTSYGSSSAVNSTLTTSHSVPLSGITANTLYHYRVKSSSNGNLAVSADNSFTTIATPPADTTAPTVPLGVTATAISSSQINLSWTVSTDTDNTSAQISYTIYRGGIQITTTAAGATSYSDTALSASTAYSYTISASDPAGNTSAQSTAASATTQTNSPPPSGNYLVVTPTGGGNKSGADWNNAMAGLPATLNCGYVYYLADGKYPKTTLSTNGTCTASSPAEVRKAQDYDHGSAVGWQNATTGYGNGQAVFNTAPVVMSISSPYVILNGNGQQADPGCGGAGTGTSTYTTAPPNPKDCGILVKPTAGASGSYDAIGTRANDTLKYVEVWGIGDSTVEDGAIDVTSAPSITVSHVFMHNVGCVYMDWLPNNMTITYSYFWALDQNGQGTWCHSEATMGGANTITSGTINNSVWRDFNSTALWAWVSPSSPVSNLSIYNNVIWCSASGFTGCALDDGIFWPGNTTNNANVTIAQNTAINLGYSASWYGTNNAGTATNLVVENNLAYSGAGMADNPNGSTYAYNSYVNVTGGCPAQSAGAVCITSGAPNPFVNWQAGDFRLASENADWNNRLALGAPYNTDISGAAFSTDRGAYQFVSGTPPPADITAPSVPTGLSTTALSTSAINLSWGAASDPDNSGSQISYTVYRNGSEIGTTAAGATSYSDTGLSTGTSYTYTVSAADPAGNTSAQSSSASATTQANPDTTPPTVSISSPAAGIVAGSITVSATASDPVVAGQTNSGLALVTVSIDGSVFATSTTGTISRLLDTTTLTNASHTITAIAKDNAGNSSLTASVSITVNNAVVAKFPRLVVLSSLEGLAAVPANTTITAFILSGGTVLETQANLTANASNQYTISFLPTDPQIVDIRISVPGYLSDKLTSIDTTVNSSSPLSVPQLLAGDINNDNTINSLDYSALNGHFLQNYAPADINRDGLVNSLDYAILKNNYGKSGQ